MPPRLPLFEKFVAGDRPEVPELMGVRSHMSVRQDAVTSPLGDEICSETERNCWRAAGICEITNFTALRRRLGSVRGNELVYDLLRQIVDEGASVHASVISRCEIELSYTGDSLDAVTNTASVLATACKRPFDLADEMNQFDVVIGVAASPSSEIDYVHLVEQAEGALEEARAHYGLLVRDLSLGAPAFDRLTLTRDLPGSIEREEMFLQYQPKVHVRKQEINSAEALVRWQHPTRGLILPGDFITLAEDSGYISALTIWTLNQVIHDQSTIIADGHNLTLFINISAQLLSDTAFVNAVCFRLQDCDARIGFEITETAVIRDPQVAIANLKLFAETGIIISIDDYGAGLSSLAYLKQLPARELKIDKQFILNLTSSNRDPLIVRSTIDLAHALDMEVTAEGVESPAALALLSVMGCDVVQGYLISRPISIDAFRQFLRDDNIASWPDIKRGTFKQPASFWKRG